MKKIILLFVLTFLGLSCQEDVKFNNPSIEGQKQGVIWRANDFKATVTANGVVVITGTKGLESVSIKTFTINPHTSLFGVDGSNFAEYNSKVIGEKGNYSTGFNGGNGQIIITKYENNTLTGSFKFKSINTNLLLDDPDYVTFTKGVFYKIPVIKVK